MNFDEVTRDIYVTPIIKIVTKNRKGQNILLNGRRISQVYVYVLKFVCYWEKIVLNPCKRKDATYLEHI